MKKLFFLSLYFICFLAKSQSDTLDMLMNSWYMKPNTENNMSLSSLFCDVNFSLDVEAHLSIFYDPEGNMRGFKYKELVPLGSSSFDGWEKCQKLGKIVYSPSDSGLTFNTEGMSKFYHIIKLDADSLILVDSIASNFYRFYAYNYHRYKDDYLNYTFFKLFENKIPKSSKIIFFLKPKENYLYNKKSDIVIEIRESSMDEEELKRLIKRFLNRKRKKYIRQANCSFIFIPPIDYTDF